RLRHGARTAGRRQPDANADAAVFQVERVRVPLRAVTDDRDLLLLDQRKVRVVVVVHRRHVTPLTAGTTKRRRLRRFAKKSFSFKKGLRVLRSSSYLRGSELHLYRTIRDVAA